MLRRRSSVDEMVQRGLLRNKKLGEYDAPATKLEMEMRRNSLSRSLRKIYSNGQQLPENISNWAETDGIVKRNREELKHFFERRFSKPLDSHEELQTGANAGKEKHEIAVTVSFKEK